MQPASLNGRIPRFTDSYATAYYPTIGVAVIKRICSTVTANNTPQHPVARMEAAGRNPGKLIHTHSRKRFHTTTAGPGLPPKGTSFGAHPGYNSTRSPDGGHRPESGEVNSHSFTKAFSHNHRPPRIATQGDFLRGASGLQQHPVARMAAEGQNPGKFIHIQSRMRFCTTTAGPGLHPGYKIIRSPDGGRNSMRPLNSERNFLGMITRK